MKTFKEADEELKKAQEELLKKEVEAFLEEWNKGNVSVGSPYWLTYRQYIK